MMISTKGRYGLRVMLDISQQKSDDFISIKSISQRQGISMKYLEMIVSSLNKSGLLKSQRGKDGGYKLAKKPDEYTVGEIIRAAEGKLTAVACSGCSQEGDGCERSAQCLTLPIWKKLDLMVNSCLDEMTLTDVLNGNIEDV